jgi:hypothetical protein
MPGFTRAVFPERRAEHVPFVACSPWRHSSSRLLGCALVAGVSGLLDACSDTTEAGDQTFVTINSASPVVLRGDQLELTASLWIRTASGDSVEVPNAELMWTTDDPTLTPKDNRTAMATGVNSGVVGIHAIATGGSPIHSRSTACGRPRCATARRSRCTVWA